MLLFKHAFGDHAGDPIDGCTETREPPTVQVKNRAQGHGSIRRKPAGELQTIGWEKPRTNSVATSGERFRAIAGQPVYHPGSATQRSIRIGWNEGGCGGDDTASGGDCLGFRSFLPGFSSERVVRRSTGPLSHLRRLQLPPQPKFSGPRRGGCGEKGALPLRIRRRFQGTFQQPGKIPRTAGRPHTLEGPGGQAPSSIMVFSFCRSFRT